MQHCNTDVKLSSTRLSLSLSLNVSDKLSVNTVLSLLPLRPGFPRTLGLRNFLFLPARDDFLAAAGQQLPARVNLSLSLCYCHGPVLATSRPVCPGSVFRYILADQQYFLSFSNDNEGFSVVWRRKGNTVTVLSYPRSPDRCYQDLSGCSPLLPTASLPLAFFTLRECGLAAS